MQSLEDIPTWFSDYFDISLEAGQIILSIVVIFMVLLPVLYLTRGKGVFIPVMTFVLLEALLVGIGWLNAWVMIATVCIMSLFIAKIGSGFVSGE